MEAVPRLPMIQFDMKTCPDRSYFEFGRIKQYIREFYNEDPESYSSEIRNLETLRATAVRPVKDVAGCAVLKKYFCQLHFLQSRFPMGKDGKAAITFSWKDAYGSSVTTSNDINLEMVAILYNIGALHTQLGAANDRTSADGLKMACTHFQCAAWAFQHLKDSYPQSSGMELSSDVMQFKYQLCLGQAQECILEKSMTDNRKATINAKVATQIVDYYNLALNTLLQPPAHDDPIIQDIVGSKLHKSWKKYIKFKIAYYTCVALLYQGMQAEEQQKMGERVAYYQGALDKLADAIKLSKNLDQSEAVMETLVFTRDVVEGKRKGAKNENEFIYHEEVPELDALPNVKGASLVKGIPFNINDPEISGPDIFSRLVPMKAHEASSLYSEEKAKLLRRINAMIDSKDEEIVSFMSCLQLDYIKSHFDTSLLPQEVVDRCAALNAMPDAIPNLMAAMNKLNEAYVHVDSMLKEINELIKEEEISEKDYQEIMGTRPPSIVATDLTREAVKYTEAHKKAAESNETLHKAMTQHIENLRVLQQPLSEIISGLPNLSGLNLNEDQSLKEVIALVNKVNEMRKQRAMLASQLRESICSDDITGQLITRADEKMEDIFIKEMEKHNKYVTLIEQNLSAQENITRALTDAYAKYTPTRKATAEIMRQRDLMLTALISSYDAYEDLLSKSSKGQDFYRKLETNLTKLLQRVKGTCRVQQEERDSILEQNSKKALKMSEDTGSKLKHYLKNKQIEKSSPYYSPVKTDAYGVRPAPLGSEAVSSSTKPEPQIPSYNQSYYNTYVDPKYSNSYYQLYSQNSPLKTLQYPNMDGEYDYNVNMAAYRGDHDYTAAPSSGYSSSASSTPQHNYSSAPTDPKYQYSQGAAQAYTTQTAQTYPVQSTVQAYANSQPAQTYPPQAQSYTPQTATYPSQATGQVYANATAQAYTTQTGQTYPSQSASYSQTQSFTPQTAQTYTSSQATPQSYPSQPTGQPYTYPSSQSSAPAYTPQTTAQATPQTYPSSQSSAPAYTPQTAQATPQTYPSSQPSAQTYTTTQSAQDYNQTYSTPTTSPLHTLPKYSETPTSFQYTTTDYSYPYNNYTNPSTTWTPEYQKQLEEQQNQEKYLQQYYPYGYTNTYPQAQFQNTPGTHTSYYSSAGSKTVDSTVSPTYNASFDASIAQDASSYYSQPYGYQYYNNGVPAPVPKQVENIAKNNSVTYMQSSAKTDLTVTFSQQEKGASNVDLLTGLDFNISDAPLLPTVPKNNIEKAQDQLSNLTIKEDPPQIQPEVKAETPKNEEKPIELERPSPSKTPLKDPFSDHENLSLFIQDVEKFEKFVEGLNSKTLNGPTALDLKWNELQDLQEKDTHKLSISVARCYPMKNRYADILPYDNSRVELPSTKDDYINASFVKDLGPGCPNFIMTQSPLPSTYADFWCMVFEQHVELVICLLSENQLNNEVYWPSNKIEDLTFGKMKISLQSCNFKNNWIERIFSVSDGKSSRVVMHLEFISWPQSWLPESPGPLLNLVSETYAVWSQQRGRGPVVVHCQSGVGRSGVFVFVMFCMSELRIPPIHLPDVINLLLKIGKLRKNPLRDRQHLQFAYQCLLYYVQDLLMKRGILASRATFEEKRVKSKSHTRHPSEDFLLNSLKDHEERRQSDASSTGSIKPNECDPLSQIDPLWPIKRYS